MLLHFQICIQTNSFQFQLKLFKVSAFLQSLCGTKSRMKKKTERNGKNYYLNDLILRRDNSWIAEPKLGELPLTY